MCWNVEKGMTEDYYKGVLVGLQCYAFWKDGVEVVGTCATPLKVVREEVFCIAESSGISIENLKWVGA